MDIILRKDHCFGLSVFILFVIQFCSSGTVYMSEICGATIALSNEPEGVVTLGLTQDDVYSSFTDCYVTVVVTGRHSQIGITFLDIDIMSFEPCQNDYLQIYDGIKVDNSTFLYTGGGHYKKFCGRTRPAHVTSVHSNVTLRFVSDALYSSKGFTLLLTAFHTGICQDHEYHCSNSRCIHESLECDDYDNCGDESDLCQVSTYLIVGVAFTAVFTTIALIFLFSVLRYRFKNKPSEYEIDFDAVSLGRDFTCPPGTSFRSIESEGSSPTDVRAAAEQLECRHNNGHINPSFVHVQTAYQIFG